MLNAVLGIFLGMFGTALVGDSSLSAMYFCEIKFFFFFLQIVKLTKVANSP